jgi:hypothetical protein
MSAYLLLQSHRWQEQRVFIDPECRRRVTAGLGHTKWFAALMGSCLVLSSAALASQNSAVTWSVPADVDSNDRREILAVARRVGLDGPQRVLALPGGSCSILLVESRPNVEGRRVSFTSVFVSRIRGRECALPDDPKWVRVGNWATSMATPKQHEKWRIRDGNWRVDIYLRDVDYDTAERIVRTVRREALVERCSIDSGASARHGSADISSVTPASAGSPDYLIYTSRGDGGGGIVVHVRVSRTAVDLVRCLAYDN